MYTHCMFCQANPMWRAAEEIAAISDDLFVPSGWAAFKRKPRPPEEES